MKSELGKQIAGQAESIQQPANSENGANGSNEFIGVFGFFGVFSLSHRSSTAFRRRP